jgi:RimJ/RimL family protein N-acetyltransferase
VTLRLAIPSRPEIVLRSLSAGDEPDLRRIHAEHEVARWWGIPEDGFPWEDPASTRLTIQVDGRIAGLIQFSEELEPRYRHATIDLYLDPRLHGRGIGTEALRRVAQYLIEDRGHHRITIDPAAANAAALRSYEKAGFRRVGVMRRYERDVDGDGWHDGVLMELLADDVDAASDVGSHLTNQ